MSLFASYLPIDRRAALSLGRELPDRASGTALFADISGFTKLTDSLVEAFGRKRGAEEILPLLNRIFEEIIAAIHLYGGSVIYFSGDAVTCWFDRDDGLRAVSAASEMQSAMNAFEHIRMAGGFQASIRLKVSIASGDVRRFVVGSPHQVCIDVIAGQLVDLVAQGERMAASGEVLLTEAAALSIARQIEIREWRTGIGGERFAILENVLERPGPSPWPRDLVVPDELSSQFVLPSVAERLRTGLGHYLAEIRPATALFMQFGGLDYDGEDGVGETLDQYIRWVQEVIERFSGVILQLTIGDKGAYLYLGFGVPVAHSDDTARAVAAAIALRNVPAGLGAVRQVKIGLAHGQMRTGAYGSQARLTYGVMGAQVNRAARLMSLAPPGEIYFDQSVHTAVSSRWETKPVHISKENPLLKSTPLGEVYCLTGHQARSRRPQSDPRPLVGRKAELARLNEILDQAAAGRTGRIFVTGEAGIGKSRLIGASVDSARGNGFLVLEGAGTSTEQQTVYWAWRDVLASLFGWVQEDSPDERLQRIAGSAGEITADNAARLPLLNDIAYLNIPENDLTSSFSGQLRQDNLVLLIADLIRARSQRQPLMLVFDDVHWMDEPSWDLSVRVADILSGREERVAFIWVSRPLEGYRRYGARLDAVWRMEDAPVLDLRALPEQDIHELIASELGTPSAGLPVELVELVRTKSEGNPLYTREMLLNLKERRMIWPLGASEGTHWQMAEDFEKAASTLPDTLQGLILARLDRLSFEMQAVLKVASVIGRSFALEPLKNVLGENRMVESARVGEHLAGLVMADMIQPEAAGGYTFSHVLTRDASYQTLLSEQRKQLHHSIAGWYESAYALEALAPHYPILAHHFREAEQVDREYLYVCLSADQAYARYANREALDYWERALELATTSADRFELHLKREEVFGLIGDRSAQFSELQQMESLCHQQASPVWEAALAVRSARYEQLNGNYREAGSQADRAIALGRETADRRLGAIGAQRKGKILLEQGSYDEAREHFDAALEEFERLDSGENVAEVFGDYGILEVYRGDFSAAVPHFERAIELHQRNNNRREAARNLANLGGAYALLANSQRAIFAYEEAYEINRVIGDRRTAHIALGNLGIVYGTSGDYGRALEHLNEALITSRELGDLRKEGTWLGSLGEVYLSLGRVNQATDYFEEALRISMEIGNRSGQGQWLNLLGEAARLRGALGEAMQWIESGLEINEALGNQNYLVNSFSTLGQILLEQQEWSEANRVFLQAFRLREQLGQMELSQDLLPWLAYCAWKRLQIAEALGYLESFMETWAGLTVAQQAEKDIEALYSAAQVFEAMEDPRANQLVESAYRILMARGDRIEDPVMREEFLSAVPVHSEIRSAFERFNSSPS